VDTAYQTGDATTGTPPQLLANVNQYIIFNNSGASITFPCTGNSITQIAVANKAFGAIDSYDATLAANDEVYLIGRVSSSTDQNTGSYWIHGWHAGSHQHHGIHLPKKALSADKMISVNSPGGSNAAANQVPLADGSGGVTWGTAPGASGMTNPMTSPGDMIYGGTAGAATRLPAGTVSGTVLRYNSATNIPTWGYPPRIQDGTTGNNFQLKNTGYALSNGTTNTPTVTTGLTGWTAAVDSHSTPFAGTIVLTNNTGNSVVFGAGTSTQVAQLTYSSASFTNPPVVHVNAYAGAASASTGIPTASAVNIYLNGAGGSVTVANLATLTIAYILIGQTA
jgi:hypothetical protein